MQDFMSGFRSQQDPAAYWKQRAERAEAELAKLKPQPPSPRQMFLNGLDAFIRMPNEFTRDALDKALRLYEDDILRRAGVVVKEK
jgi:hypothetical protein